MLSQLSFRNFFLVFKRVGVLILQKNLAASSSARDDGVHDDNVGLHDVVGYLSRAGIHEQGGDQNDQSPRDQKTDVAATEFPGLVRFVHFKNLENLTVA